MEGPPITVLPCGGGCGVTFVIAKLVDPKVIQDRVREEGWRPVDVDGVLVMCCPECVTARRPQAEA